MKKIFFAAVFAGALLGFTSCGNREMVTGPEMETVIDSIKETQSGQTTEETTAGTEETAEVSRQKARVKYREVNGCSLPQRITRVAVIPKTRPEVIPITIQQLQ
jgi:hypothetical protein